MKKAFWISIFLCILFNAYSQDYDLIVTVKADSIACRIDSITDATIYFEMKHSNNWIHTNINRNEVIEYKYSAIDEKQVIFLAGTSYVMPNSDRDAYLIKALKLQRSGKTLIYTGIGAIVGGTVFAFATGGGLGWTGVIIGGSIFWAGVGMEVVGIPMRIIGTKRVKSINQLNNSLSNRIRIDLKPCMHYNPIAQNCQPGVMLRIRF